MLGQVQKLKEQVASLQDELNQLKSVRELETQNARLTATNEAQALILDAYQKGLQAGFNMAKSVGNASGVPMPRPLSFKDRRSGLRMSWSAGRQQLSANTASKRPAKRLMGRQSLRWRWAAGWLPASAQHQDRGVVGSAAEDEFHSKSQRLRGAFLASMGGDAGASSDDDGGSATLAGVGRRQSRSELRACAGETSKGTKDGADREVSQRRRGNSADSEASSAVGSLQPEPDQATVQRV